MSLSFKEILTRIKYNDILSDLCEATRKRTKTATLDAIGFEKLHDKLKNLAQSYTYQYNLVPLGDSGKFFELFRTRCFDYLDELGDTITHEHFSAIIARLLSALDCPVTDPNYYQDYRLRVKLLDLVGFSLVANLVLDESLNHSLIYGKGQEAVAISQFRQTLREVKKQFLLADTSHEIALSNLSDALIQAIETARPTLHNDTWQRIFIRILGVLGSMLTLGIANRLSHRSMYGLFSNQEELSVRIDQLVFNLKNHTTPIATAVPVAHAVPLDKNGTQQPSAPPEPPEQPFLKK